MASYKLYTYKDLIDAVCEEVGVQASDTITRNRIKRDINIIYMDEVVPVKQWWWLRNHIDLVKDAKFSTGTASVTQGSRSVVLTELPTESYKGAWLNTKGTSERYKVQEHTAGTATLTLEVGYVGSTNSEINFTLWRDTLPLPPDANEVVEVTQDHLNVPMSGSGLQELRRIIQASPLTEARPRYYSTTDFVEPEPFGAITGLPASATRTSSGLLKSIKFASSLGTTPLIAIGTRIKASGSGHATYNTEDGIVVNVSTTTNTNDTITYIGSGLKTETAVVDVGITVKAAGIATLGERYRELMVHPSIYDSNVVIHVDYLREATPLEDDEDEPLMPVEDRVVLLYGTLHRTWSKQRNPEEAARNLALYDNKLKRMQGKSDDSPDKPQIRVSNQYITRLRGGARTRTSAEYYQGSGGGSTSNPQGTANHVAIFGADGYLQSGTISVADLDNIEGLVDNVQDQIDEVTIEDPVGNRAVITNGLGRLAESDVTATALNYLVDTSPLTTVVLPDATASATALLSVASATYNVLHIDYTLNRNGVIRGGKITIVSDGTTAHIAEGGVAETADVGVVFDATQVATNMTWTFTTTSTGNAATLKYKAHKWLA